VSECEKCQMLEAEYLNLFNCRAARVSDLQKAVWIAMDKKSCPGVYMQIASEAIYRHGLAEIADLKKEIDRLNALVKSMQADITVS
jgi:hypothetical protein